MELVCVVMDMRDWVAVSDCPGIECSIVHICFVQMEPVHKRIHKAKARIEFLFDSAVVLANFGQIAHLVKTKRFDELGISLIVMLIISLILQPYFVCRVLH